jgi:PIN domain nuclease of toxin-antitoxin system
VVDVSRRGTSSTSHRDTPRRSEQSEPLAPNGVPATAIFDSRTELLFSPVTPWELATKHHRARFPEVGALLRAFPESALRIRATELPIASRHGLLAGRLEWEHRDPFDRMLAAQSILEGARLVTADRAFSTLPGVDIFW